MATWVTHLMIADRVLARVSGLDRHGFCVGNIAPDCNVENEDWTAFVPSREITHWMSSERKNASDCERFYDAYVSGRKHADRQEASFMLGYYAHLVADAEFQRYIRDPERVAAAWRRLRSDPELAGRAAGMPETWDSVKLLIGRKEWAKDIAVIEAEYLAQNPDSGYLTEIIGLKTFPDYIDYLPDGAIVRKIGVMGILPQAATGKYPFVAMTRQEYAEYLDNATERVLRGINNR